MLWQQNGRREDAFSGSAAYGWFRAGSLGQADQAWYARAKAAVEAHDALVARASGVASEGARAELLARHDTAATRSLRDAVARDVAAAEARSPVDYAVFAGAAARGRVERLEQGDMAFSADVADAEGRYGTQLEAETDWRGPVLALAAAAAAGIALNLVL